MDSQTLRTRLENTPPVEAHTTLNPAIFDADQMRLDVRITLLRAAIAFYKTLEIQRLVVRDIILTGSNAAYHYTDASDIDVHLVVEFSGLQCPDLAARLFDAKKTLWNANHDISVFGFDVELYVENAEQPAESRGVYSILHGEWVRRPERVTPTTDEAMLVANVERYSTVIDQILQTPDIALIKRFLSKLKKMRQSGLSDNGEFSIENLTYKALRTLGYLDRLWDAMETQLDRELSLGSRPAP